MMAIEPHRAAKVSQQVWQERREAERRLMAAREAMANHLTRATYGVTLTIVSALHGLDPVKVRAELSRPGERSADPRWLAASRVRDVAIYLINTTLNVEQHFLARAAGMSNRGVGYAIGRVEDRRDDPQVERLVALAETIVKGEG